MTDFRIENRSTGGGGMTIGAPVSGGDPNLVLYVDASGELAQHPDLSFDGSVFVVGADSFTTLSAFAGTSEFYDGGANLTMGIGNTYGGVTVNPGYLTSENFSVLGSGANDPTLLFVYPFGNTVALGQPSDLGGTVGMQAYDVSDPTLIIRAVAAQNTYLTAWQASDGTQVLGVDPGGVIDFGNGSTGTGISGDTGGEITLNAYGGANCALRINGRFGINVTPTGPSTGWSITNVSSDKTFDASAADLAETRNVLGTLLNYLGSVGFLTA